MSVFEPTAADLLQCNQNKQSFRQTLLYEIADDGLIILFDIILIEAEPLVQSKVTYAFEVYAID